MIRGFSRLASLAKLTGSKCSRCSSIEQHVLTSMQQNMIPFSASRLLHSTGHGMAIDIQVPSMGDSITEGTICAVLKEAQSRVEEDEPIVQIETDKVTIDVRAPSSGVLRALLVKVDENVEVGQVVAVLDETTGKRPTKAIHTESTVEAPAPQSVSEPKKVASSWDEMSMEATEKSYQTYRKASIKFPPRRTAVGGIISAMPSIDQAKYIHRGTEASLTQEPVKPSRYVMFDDQIPRQSLSDREMESINLGGAE